jgi:Rod binding domain-containing protein
MSGLPASAPAIDLLAKGAPPAGPRGKSEAEIKRTAQDFEAAFIAQLLGDMFKGVETPAPFNGGAGEDAFKSFFVEAVAKQMARAGGLGLADDLAREMLKMQGLT